MAAVPQKTLNWLYNVVTREYRDPNRTYSDLAQTLARYPSFAPRTDVYTFENGISALLAHFTGTLPVSFRGTTYQFPIALWIPHAYPYEAPLVYVTPTENMLVRPGQHVAGDGRVYHHYLAHWREAWDRSNLVDFLSILSDIFAKEPPVMSRQQMMSRLPVPNTSTAPPPRPPLPQDLQKPGPSSRDLENVPSYGAGPPPPPKQPSQDSAVSASSALRRPGRYDAPPPLPPQPSRSSNAQNFSPPLPPNGEGMPPISGLNYAPQLASSLRQESNQIPTPSSGGHAQNWTAAPPHMHPPPPEPHGMPGAGQQQFPSQGYSVSNNRVPQYQTHVSGPPQFPPNMHRGPPPAQQLSTKPPPVDLLDSPFDVALPVASNLPAPTVPRNPEKDALLSAISTALTQTLHNSIAQNNAALPSLQAQHAALSSTYQQLESELANLNSLNSTLTSNVNILQASLQKSDVAIASSRERAKRGDVPKVDEMLTAPTVVGKQLYDIVCEERGIEAGIRALQEGLVRGRIGAELWAKKTRELAREGFRKRVLAQKIGDGMGLDGA